MIDHTNCPSRETRRVLLPVATGGRVCGWLSTVHCLCWCIKTLPSFLTVHMQTYLQSNRYLATLHASGQLNSSHHAYIRKDVSEDMVTTCKVYQNNTHSPYFQDFSELFIYTSQSTFIGSLKVTTRSFETHTGWEDKATLWQWLLAGN